MVLFNFDGAGMTRRITLSNSHLTWHPLFGKSQSVASDDIIDIIIEPVRFLGLIPGFQLRVTTLINTVFIRISERHNTKDVHQQFDTFVLNNLIANIERSQDSTIKQAKYFTRQLADCFLSVGLLDSLSTFYQSQSHILHHRLFTNKFAQQIFGPDADTLISLHATLKELLAQDKSAISLHNEQFTKRKQVQYKDAFSHIEKFPLTKEQQDAIICGEDNVVLVAAAGSGKSSTLVGKLYFLLHEGVRPENIICFAYNTDAAKELNERISRMHTQFKLAGEPVQASTFHAYSMQVIANATQRKPSISPLATDGHALHLFFCETITQLRQSSTDFADAFNDYMLLHKTNVQPSEGFKTKQEYDDFMRELGASQIYNVQTKQQEWRLHTLNGLQVASLEERDIVNWLVTRGVRFEYEKPFVVDTATQTHRQYFPDFYYPEQDVWHEHFALNAQGKAPDFFTGGSAAYEDGVRWKRELHSELNTHFFETTSAHVRQGELFSRLEEQLTAFGVTQNPLSQAQLDSMVNTSFNPEKDIKIFITCLHHCKTNHISVSALTETIQSTDDTRAKAFLKVFAPLYDAYENAMHKQGCIDFDDLLHQAAALIETGDYQPEFSYILVDEAQDMSSARARIVKALADSQKAQVFAVGDDWQSIYRFSGADMRFMTDFSSHFGHSQQLALTRTFRSNQNIVDVASAFVQKNPEQIRKKVHAHMDSDKQSVLLADYTAQDDTKKLHLFLSGCVIRAKQANERRSVFILTRYNDQRPAYLNKLRAMYKELHIDWSSIHRAKGLEADYVVLHHVNSGAYGFPSVIEDDPILHYVTPKPELFPHAEERRLMYVALTRAKHAVLILFKQGISSTFVKELAQNPNVHGFHTEIHNLKPEYCPTCKSGELSVKKGRFGLFHGCSNYPTCEYIRACNCPCCENGKIVSRKNKQGRVFYSCSRYPDCDHIERNMS